MRTVSDLNQTLADLDLRLALANSELAEAKLCLDVCVVSIPTAGTDEAKLQLARSRCVTARNAVRKLRAESEETRGRLRQTGFINNPAPSFLSISKPKSRQESPFIRQATILTALTLAFLQYYFLDVQLQIARLPSSVTIFVS
jgi:hypothetical protein